ncbi:MAG: DUF503 domain-containing protein [Chloroflexota bacterium]|nr:DUF503 domain-containing protein [Chloroflexota bacterium]
MLRFSLRLPESASLKDKRQVVRSVAQRLRNKFQVAVAEVADNDAWQIATFGVACVANDAHHCQDVLRQIVSFVEGSRLDAEVFDVDTEILSL